MAKIRRRPRPGHDEHPLHDLRPRRRPWSRSIRRNTSRSIPKPGWVEHDPMEIWTRSVEVIRGALAKAGITAADLAAVGVTNQRETTVVWDRKHRQARLQRDRLAGHPHRRHLQRARQGRRPGSPSPEGRPAAGDLLLRPQGQVDPRQRRGRPRQGRGRRPALRQHRHLVHLEPHRRRRRRRPRHGRLQRQPHHADEPRRPSTGIPRSCSSWASRAPCCRPSRPPSEVYGTAVGDLAGVPVAGDLGDQQAALFGQTCFSRRRGEEHLRHRLLHAPQHGHQGRARPRAASSPPSATRSATSRPCTPSRARSRSPARSCSGCATTSAMIKTSPEIEELAKTVDDNGGVYFVPAFSRPVRPVLEERRARRHRRPDPLRQQGPHRPGRARGDRLADPRSARRDERRLRRSR